MTQGIPIRMRFEETPHEEFLSEIQAGRNKPGTRAVPTRLKHDPPRKPFATAQFPLERLRRPGS